MRQVRNPGTPGGSLSAGGSGGGGRVTGPTRRDWQTADTLRALPPGAGETTRGSCTRNILSRASPRADRPRAASPRDRRRPDGRETLVPLIREVQSALLHPALEVGRRDAV